MNPNIQIPACLLRGLVFLLFISHAPTMLHGAETPKREAKPHVLFVVADDLRADVTSTYGRPVKTPNLDKLAARGCLFTRATCGYPICHVSRTEMLTGRSLVAEAVAGKAIPFQPDWALWPDEMRKAGWHTVYSGKWHVQGTPWTRGYAETFGLYSSGGATGRPLTFPQSATGRAVTGYTGWTFKTNENQPLPDLGIGLTPDTDVRIADGAIDAIRKRSGKPLFLHVNFPAPHDPLHWPTGSEERYKPGDVKLPRNFLSRHPFNHGNLDGRDETIVPAPRHEDEVQRERAVYFALVENLDAQLGRILKALQENGMLENTLVIYTSDHGLALGSHGLMGKQNQYEHTARVPLVLAGPNIPAGRRLTAQCVLRDIFPTVCELSKLAIPASVQGKSLAPVLCGEKAEVHDAVFGYFTDTQRMIRTADGWKLIWYPRADRVQLFRVSDDPEELHDLSAEPAHKERAEQLMRSLKEWLSDRQDSPGSGNK